MEKDRLRLRLFIIDAPSPMDLLQNRSEALALEKVCALIGHEVSTFTVKSILEFETVCKFIAAIDADHDQYKRQGVPLCVHIAAHGNKDGLGIGPELVDWKRFHQLLQPLCTDLNRYDGPVIMVISACRASHQKLTREFKKQFKQDSKLCPPAYLFITADDEPSFDDAAVSWTVFYHQLPGVSLDDRAKVRAILRRVKESGAATLKYYRWDTHEKSYRQYTPKPHTR